MSAAGKRWMGKVAKVPCVLCAYMGLGETPAIVHHMKIGTGASDRASDWLTIALCNSHHVGPEGVHVLKEKGLRLRYNLSEIDLLAFTLEAIR
jgi:Recombination enhancement, RecA-dependent nuclease